MDKKILSIFTLTLLLVGMFAIPLISSYSEETIDEEADTSSYPSDSWFGRLWSNFKESSGLFTVYGDELQCEKFPSTIVTWRNFPGFKNKKVSVDSGESLFINWYRGSPENGQYSDHPNTNRQYMGEIYLGPGGNNEVTLTCDSGSYWNRDCYYEIYQCPNPCFSDSQCSTGEICSKSVLSQKIPDAGVCKATIPEHQTDVYSCENGERTSLGSVGYGSSNFCTDSSDSKYLIGTTDSCLPDQNEPAECYESNNNGNGNGDSQGCSELSTALFCEASKSCEWENNECKTKEITGSCSPINSEILCEASSYCVWDNDECVNEELVQREAISPEELTSSTYQSLKDSACTLSSQCPTDSRCLSQEYLVDEGYMTNNDARNHLDNYCSDESIGRLLDRLGKFIGISDDVCGSLFNDLNQWKYNYGYCISEEESNLDKYLSWAAFFDVDGDGNKDGLDGAIIVGGLVVVLVVFGGGRR